MNKSILVEVIREDVIKFVLSKYDDTPDIRKSLPAKISRQDFANFLGQILTSDMELIIPFDFDVQVYGYAKLQT